jgi:hypothetical protein
LPTLLAYVVRQRVPPAAGTGGGVAAEATEEALRRQLAPVLEVEAAYAQAESTLQRLVLVLEDADSFSESCGGSLGEAENDHEAAFAQRVVRHLGDRGLDNIEVISVLRRDREALFNLALNLAEAMAPALLRSARACGDTAFNPCGASVDRDAAAFTSSSSGAEAAAPVAPLPYPSSLLPHVSVGDFEFVLRGGFGKPSGTGAGRSGELRGAEPSSGYCPEDHLAPGSRRCTEALAEIWQPGRSMTMITASHGRVPLMCPEGDLSQGLIGLAPGCSRGLAPVFWERVLSPNSLGETAGRGTEQAGLQGAPLAAAAAPEDPAAFGEMSRVAFGRHGSHGNLSNAW